MGKEKTYGKIVRKIIDVFADLLIATKISYLPSPYYTLGKFIKALLEEDKSLNKKQIKKALYDLEKR